MGAVENADRRSARCQQRNGSNPGDRFKRCGLCSIPRTDCRQRPRQSVLFWWRIARGADGRSVPQLFLAELRWKEYALLQRLHLLDHRTQMHKLIAACGH